MKWMDEARRHVGLKEVPGKGDNPAIQKWLKSLSAWWSDDATPWCGTFCAHCIKTAGLPLPKHWYRAKDWLNWGVPLAGPTLGCIVVFERQGGGHVGFVAGKDKAGNLMVLGGNQGDAVTIAAFDPKRVAGYRYPDNSFREFTMPLVASNGKLSSNEA
jgi:uncharacterized protein (TIGR02594 family)